MRAAERMLKLLPDTKAELPVFGLKAEALEKFHRRNLFLLWTWLPKGPNGCSAAKQMFREPGSATSAPWLDLLILPRAAIGKFPIDCSRDALE
jgi:hypothetical protein